VVEGARRHVRAMHRRFTTPVAFDLGTEPLPHAPDGTAQPPEALDTLPSAGLRPQRSPDLQAGAGRRPRRSEARVAVLALTIAIVVALAASSVGRTTRDSPKADLGRPSASVIASPVDSPAAAEPARPAPTSSKRRRRGPRDKRRRRAPAVTAGPQPATSMQPAVRAPISAPQTPSPPRPDVTPPAPSEPGEFF
jgi:hypothetical protein